MTELIEKLSTYNLFNYLLPGTVFAVLAEYLTLYSFIHEEIIIAFFLFYFIGLVTSRIGSVIIEPVLKKTKFIKFAEYEEYVRASKDDEILATLSEVNNSYRTYCSVFICLGILKLFEILNAKYLWLTDYLPYVLVLFIFVMFLFAYKKQTQYILKRIQKL